MKAEHRGVEASLYVEGSRAFVRVQLGVEVHQFSDARKTGDKPDFTVRCSDPGQNGTPSPEATEYLRKQVLSAAQARGIDPGRITLPEGW